MAFEVGQIVTFRDCYGSNPKTGKIIERNSYSSLIDVSGTPYLVPDCLVEDGSLNGRGAGNGE